MHAWIVRRSGIFFKCETLNYKQTNVFNRKLFGLFVGLMEQENNISWQRAAELEKF